MLLCGEDWGWCRVAMTVLEGLKLAVALLGSWPLGVPLPLSACHSGASQQQALSQSLSAGQGPAGGACAGPYLLCGAKARA